MNGKRGDTDAPVGGALLAGSASAVVAALVSLPLRSPHDGLLNSASVTWGVLALAVMAGLLWRTLRTKSRGRRSFVVVMAAGFIGWTVAVLIAGNAVEVERMASFTVPLAAIAFGGLAVLTPTLSGARVASRKLAVAAALAVAAVVGIGLAGYGDQKSGRLELPPRAAPAPAWTAVS